MVDSTKGLYYFAPVQDHPPFPNIPTTNTHQISQIPWLDYFLDKNPLIRIGPKPTLTGVLYAFSVVSSYQTSPPTPNSKRPQHSLDKYIKLKTTHPSLIDDTQIVNYLLLNILAGGDTTSSTMRALVYYLLKSPLAYKKLATELETANLSLPAQWKDIQNLPYLDAVIRESFRINTGIAMIFERVVPKEGFTLPDGRFVKGGTKVGLNPAVTNRDKKIFGEDAEEFRPERWLKLDGETEEGWKRE